jgi:hypothetical protein
MQIDSCWGKRNPNSSNATNCWESPKDSINLCESLENKDYFNGYHQCDGIGIFYYPPSMLAGFNINSSEGLILVSCPAL